MWWGGKNYNDLGTADKIRQLKLQLDRVKKSLAEQEAALKRMPKRDSKKPPANGDITSFEFVKSTVAQHKREIKHYTTEIAELEKHMLRPLK